MPRRSEFVDYISELLKPLGAIRVKPMFGGFGLYCDERFFAVIIADTLYLQTGELPLETLVKAGKKPFVFVVHGKATQLGA